MGRASETKQRNMKRPKLEVCVLGERAREREREGELTSENTSRNAFCGSKCCSKTRGERENVPACLLRFQMLVQNSRP